MLEDEDLKPMGEEEDVLVRKGKGRKVIRPLGGEVGELVERLAEGSAGGVSEGGVWKNRLDDVGHDQRERDEGCEREGENDDDRDEQHLEGEQM